MEQEQIDVNVKIHVGLYGDNGEAPKQVKLVRSFKMDVSTVDKLIAENKESVDRHNQNLITPTTQFYRDILNALDGNSIEPYKWVYSDVEDVVDLWMEENINLLELFPNDNIEYVINWKVLAVGNKVVLKKKMEVIEAKEKDDSFEMFAYMIKQCSDENVNESLKNDIIAIYATMYEHINDLDLQKQMDIVSQSLSNSYRASSVTLDRLMQHTKHFNEAMDMLCVEDNNFLCRSNSEIKKRVHERMKETTPNKNTGLIE